MSVLEPEDFFPVAEWYSGRSCRWCPPNLTSSYTYMLGLGITKYIATVTDQSLRHVQYSELEPALLQPLVVVGREGRLNCYTLCYSNY